MKKICVVLFAILLIFIENDHDITSYAMTETWEEVLYDNSFLLHGLMYFHFYHSAGTSLCRPYKVAF